MMKTYRFSYTTTAYGKSRHAIKALKAYAWNDAATRLAEHAGKKWADRPTVEIHNAEVDGVPINPDLLPAMNRMANGGPSESGAAHQAGIITATNQEPRDEKGRWTKD